MLARLRKQRRAGGFFGDNQSVAALELAIVLPLLLALLAGVYDLSELVIIRAEVYAAAESMVSSASSLAVQLDGSTALTYDQVQEVESLIWADVPTLRDGLKVTAPLSITMSSVLFYPYPGIGCKYDTTASCNYTADVAWSESYTGTASGAGAAFDYADPTTAVAGADCATVQNYSNQVAPNAALSGYANVTEFRTLNLTTSAATAQPEGYLANDAGVAPILAVSIQYTYQPLFTLYLSLPFTFWVDAYWPVRSVKNAPEYTNAKGDVVEPLAQQFTALIGSPPSTPAGTDLNAAAYCVNTGVTDAGGHPNAIVSDP